MARTKKTTLSGASFDLSRLDPSGNFYYEATLAGNFASARTHSTSSSAGDKLWVTGNSSTLYGGAGPDTLQIAVNPAKPSVTGNNDWLISGVGANTLIGSNSTVTGAADTLIGNGRSSLVGGSVNNTFVLNTNGDKLSLGLSAGKINTVRTSLNNFNLADTAAHGAGVANVNNLLYTGNGPATLVGNDRNGSLVGSSLYGNNLIAGTGNQTLIGSNNPLVGDRLTGNGHSSLIGGLGNDTYVLNTPGDKIYIPTSQPFQPTGTDTILTTIPSLSLTDTLTYGAGILGVEDITFNDGGSVTSGTVTLGGNSLDNTIIGARNTSNFLSGGTGHDFLQGGAGNDTLVGNRFSTLNGGIGTNTYYVLSQYNGVTGDVVLDSGVGSSVIGGNSGAYPFVFNLSLTDGVSGISYLGYTGNSPATLIGNAQGDTISGGTGNNSITGGSQGNSFLIGNALDDVIVANLSNNTIDAGNGNDLVTVDTGANLATDSIAGGEGTDTLLMSIATALPDSAFSGVSSVEELVLTSDSLSASSATLGQAAQDAGIVTIIGGSGADSIDVTDFTSAVTVDISANSTGSELLKGSSTAPTTFLLQDTTALGSSTISGGNANDTLSLTTPGTLPDTIFGNLSSVEYLRLSGSSAITLGSTAQLAGITTVQGGNGFGIFTQDSLNTTALYLDGRDAYANLFLMASASQFSGNLDTIVGGLYSDTIVVGSPAQLQDGDFSSILSVEALYMTGASSVTLGSVAQAAGLSSVVGGTGASTFTQTADNRQSLLFDGHLSNTDFFVVAASDQNSNFQDTFLGNTATSDTISFSAPASLGDRFFLNVHSVENLSLTGNSAVTLGSYAQTAGMQKLSAAYGSAKFVQLATDTLPLSLDGSNAYGALFSIPSSALLATDTLLGTAPFEDTLLISGVDTNIGDSAFAHVASVEMVSLTGSSKITLDSLAGITGVSTVYGGATASTLVQGAGDLNALTLVGGVGNDFISVATGSQFLADSVVGAQGADTLQIVAPVTLTDDNFGAAISGVDVLLVSGGSSVTAAARAQAKGVSTLGGSGALAINASGYSSNVSFLVTDTGIASDTFAGGLGSANQLILNASGAYADASFANVSAVQSVSVAGGASSSVTLGSAAQLTGVSTLIAGTAATGAFGASLSQDSTFTRALTLIGGGSSDYLSVNTQAQLLNDSVAGGTGIADTLNVVGALTAFNDSLSAVSGIEILSLSGTGNSLSLGANAKAAGLTAVLGGNGGSTLAELASFGNQTFTLAGGSSTDLISVDLQSQFLTDSIAGGAGNDTLQLRGTVSGLNDAFGKVSGIELLTLGGAANSVTLNSAAQTAGIATVLGGNSKNTLAAGSSFTNPLTLAGGTDTDLFSLATQAQLLTDSVIGGIGTDTLQVLGPVSGLNDSFTGIGGIEVLNLSGTANSASLGANAQSAGILTLLGGNSGNSFTQLATDTLSLYLAGGAGSDLFVAANQSQFNVDTIVGGLGRDTLQITSLTSAVNDSSFANVSGVEVISLGATSNTLTADAVAQVAGVSAVLGGSGGNTLTQTAAFTNPLTLAGGAGTDSITVTTQAQFLADSIAGGAGNDTLLISGPVMLNDSFSRVSGIEALLMPGTGSAISLGGAALTTGINTVVGSAGGASLTELGGYGNNALTLTGGAGNDYFTVGTVAQLTADSITGGGGTDTIQITAANAVIVDTSFARATGLKALVLNGASTAVLGTNAQTNGIATVVGGTASNTLSAAAYTTLSVRLNNGASTVASGLYGGAAADFLIGGTVADTLQGWTGQASLNSASDTMTGGSGADLFVLGNNITGSTNNAYGKGGSDTSSAFITDFAAGAGADRIQLHQFGAGGADYSTLLSGSVLDIFHTNTQTTNNLVAQMTLASGTFSFANNAVFI